MHRTSRLSSLPSATGGIARLACDRVRRAGKNVAELVSRAELTLDLIDQPACRLDVNAQIKLLDLAAEALHDDYLGFRLAQDFDLREIGLLYYVMASSQSLADALRNVARYSMLNNEGVEVSIDLHRTTTITLNYVDVERHSDRHQVEFWLGALIRVCRRLTGSQLTPSLIKVRHHRSKLPADVLVFLACGIEFGANADAIIFAVSAASSPLIGADAYLNRLLLSYANEALGKRCSRHSDLRTRVEAAIVQVLPHGRANVDEIAGRLGMSRRTLARALAAEGLTFSELLDGLRAALAKRYLSEKDLPVSQIAWLLGYREASSFTHAFGRWTGSTPRQFRAGERAPPKQSRGRRTASAGRGGTR